MRRARASRSTVKGLFVGENTLGNRTIYENMRAVAEGTGVEVALVHDAARGVLVRLPLPSSVRSTLTMRRDVIRLVDRSQPDYLVVNTYKPVVFCHDLVGRLPTAVMLDATPIQFDRLGYVDDPTNHIPAAARLKYRIVRRLFHRARALLPRSRWAARSLADDYGVPRERIYVTPSAVDTELWAPTEHKPARSRVEIVFVGRDFEKKGGGELLDWFRRLGRGRARLTVVTQSAVPAEPGVRLVRAGVNSSELRELVRNADVFALPTRADCYSIAGQEAMASGLPVVLGDVGGISDLVEEGITGFLVEPGASTSLDEPLERLLSSPELREEMGRAARSRAVSTFDSRVVFERVSAVGETIARAAPA